MVISEYLFQLVFIVNDCIHDYCLVLKSQNKTSEPLKPYIIKFSAVLFTAAFFFTLTDRSYSQTISLEAETGVTWFSRNDVRIPNDGGTKFDMLELIGTNGSEF